MMMMRCLLSAMLCIFAAGCATLSDEQCRQAAAVPQGWAAVGERDGAHGRPADDRLARHGKACEAVHVAPDRGGYMQGWQRGLTRYCTVESAYNEGLGGNPFNLGLCQGVGDHPDLLHANWGLGSQIHTRSVQINDMESEITRLQAELNTRVYCREEPGKPGRGKYNTCRQTSWNYLDLSFRINTLRSEIWRLRLERSTLQSQPLIRR